MANPNLSSFIWSVADLLRGDYKQSEYGKVINTKEQFANSPDLKNELQSAIMESYDAHTSMSTQALNSPMVLRGMLDILMNHSQLYETLRARAGVTGAEGTAGLRP